MKKLVEKVKQIKHKIKHRIKIKIKCIKNKNIITEAELRKEISKDMIRSHISYIFKPFKRFILRFKNNNHRLKSILKLLTSSRFAVGLLVGILMLKTMFFYNDIGLNLGKIEETIFISFVCILIAVLPLLCIKKNRNRAKAIIIYDLLISLLLFADSVYWGYSANVLSVSQILYVKYAEEIGATLPQLLKLSYVLYFIDIPVFLGLNYIVKRLPKNDKTKYVLNKGKRRLILALVYILAVINLSPKGIDEIARSIAEVPYSKPIQIARASIYGYHIFDAYNASHKRETTKYQSYDEMLVDYLELQEYKTTKFEQEDMFGIAKDKNVIVVQLESVQNFVVGRKINGKEITPNLNKFLNENIEVSNMIVQSYSTTADSEYSMITSLYPLENGQAYSRIFCKYK